MIGGISPEVCPQGDEEIVGESGGGGFKVGVRRVSSRDPEMLT